MASASLTVTLDWISWRMMDLAFGDVTEEGWFWHLVDRRGWPPAAIEAADMASYHLEEIPIISL